MGGWIQYATTLSRWFADSDGRYRQLVEFGEYGVGGLATAARRRHGSRQRALLAEEERLRFEHTARIGRFSSLMKPLVSLMTP
jgi:hypothetical protein